MNIRLLGFIFLISVASFFPAFSQAASGDNFNFRFAPVSLLVGYADMELDYKLSPNFTLGPMLGTWNLRVSSVRVKASHIGVQGRYYFSGAHSADTWYLRGMVDFRAVSASITENSVEYSGKANGAVFGYGGGYHWFWNSFNLSLGGTFISAPAATIELTDSNGNRYRDKTTDPQVGLSIDFTIGWTF